jgi:ABC-2 type transport system ATP-binding protein
MTAISVQRITKKFGRIAAVDTLSFDVGFGTLTGFLGPNGAGKTTTLRMLLGLVHPSAGTAMVNGMPYGELVRPAFTVGAVLEATGFHPGRTARDHLRVLARPNGIPDARVDAVLGEVDLADAARRRTRGFSLGMRQRLGLAGALLGDPPILILDEPTNGLDPAGVHWLRAFLRRRVDAGGAVLVSSHLLAELALSADHVVIIDKGRLIAQGSVDELTAAHRAGVRIRTPQSRELQAVLTEGGVRAELNGVDEVFAVDATPEQVGRAVALTGLVVYEMTAVSSNLEDAYLSLTGSDGAGS